jgi:hypothetical protein
MLRQGAGPAKASERNPAGSRSSLAPHASVWIKSFSGDTLPSAHAPGAVLYPPRCAAPPQRHSSLTTSPSISTAQTWLVYSKGSPS